MAERLMVAQGEKQRGVEPPHSILRGQEEAKWAKASSGRE